MPCGPASGTVRRLCATAHLTFRSAVRSKVLISLISLLFLTVVALPLMLKGDGTLYGRAIVLLKYTLGGSAGILAVMTVWMSCQAVSRDVAERQIQLVVVKPVHPLELWTGKWLGILAMNAVLLLLTGAAVYAHIRWTLARPEVTAEERARLAREILTARHRIAPRSEGMLEQARQYVEQLRAAGRLPGNVRVEDAVAEAHHRLRVRRNAVAPGEERTWIFDSPGDPGSRSAVFLRFRCTASAFSTAAIKGTWLVGPPGQAPLFEAPLKTALGGRSLVRLPRTAVQPDRPLHVTFRNAGKDRSTTVLFDPAREPELLYGNTGFTGNLLRALLVLLGFQGLLGALGLSTGSLFSGPVATFTAGGLVLVFLLVHTFSPGNILEEGTANGHDHGETPPFVEAIHRVSARTLGRMAAPVMRFRAIEPLSDGLHIPWLTVGRAWLLLGVVYPGILGALSACLLRQRELGNPGLL